MNIQVSPQKLASREQAIALHCSGANASQWRCLVDALGPEYEVLTPEHYGCESSGPWTGEHAFTLADDAAHQSHSSTKVAGRSISLVTPTEAAWPCMSPSIDRTASLV